MTESAHANSVNAALAAAQERVAGGDYHAAVAELVAANRHTPDQTLQQQLLNYRIEGAEQLDAPEVEWSEHHSDCFADCKGLPEISPDQLEAETLRAGLLGKGGLIVRGLLDAPMVEQLRSCVRNTMLARKALAQGQADADGNPWFRRPERVAGGPVQFDSVGGDQYTETGSVWAVDSPPTAFQLIELYRQLGLAELLQEYFGESALLSVRKWVLRCIPPNNGAASGWHQDGQFLGDGIRTVNLWIALTDCGTDMDAPGLDIVADNSRDIYPTGTHGADFNWTVGQGLVDELGQKYAVERPTFRAGDAIFFDHYNLHRTAFGLADVRPRYAVESWFFAASRAPAKQQPLLF